MQTTCRHVVGRSIDLLISLCVHDYSQALMVSIRILGTIAMLIYVSINGYNITINKFIQ